MTKDKPGSPDFSDLRRQAEERFAAKPAKIDQPQGDVEKLLQELQVHRIELELQNEELRNTQLQLQESLMEYSDLYDFAPVGYFTLNEKGLILKANLAGATLFGGERSNLINKPLRAFIANESRAVFEDFRKTLFKTLTKQLCEVKLLGKGSLAAHVLIEGMVLEDRPESEKQCRIAIIDITKRKHAEVSLRQAHDELEERVRERTTELVAANQELQAEITERKRVQEILSKSEERFRSLVTATSQVVWTTDPTGEVVDDLPAWRVFTGQREEESKGCGWIEAVHPQDRQRTTELWNQAVESRTTYDTEYRLRRYDGEYRHSATRGVPVVDKDGSIREWVGTCTDITERKLAEEALRRYALLSKHAGEIILFISQDGRILEANEAACAAYGYDRGTILGLTINDLRAPETRHQIPDQIDKAFRGGDFFETKHVRNDGSVFPVEVSSRSVEIGEDRILLNIIRDITKRKRAEEALKKAEEKYRRIFENAVEGIFQVTTEGRFLSVNPAFAGMCAFRNPEEMMRAITDIETQLYADPGDGTKIKALYEGVGVVKNFETQFRRTDGRVIWVSINARAVRDEDGNTLYFEGTIEDVTERKRAEQEKEELVRQLWQAQKLEAIGTLAGGIAHDFNNILAIIMFNVDHLRFFSSAFTEESSDKGRLDDAFKACVRAKDLVKQILVFSRMESRTERQRVNLGTLINETLGFLRSSLPTTIEIRRNISDKDLLVSANATQIQQVLTNLCTNAAHAMEERGGILEVSLTKVDFDSAAVLPRGDIKPGPWVKLTVSDAGQGMDAWTLERIFDPYFTTKKVGKGSGLGLSVVRGIVKQHEGAITVHSEPGKDTTFDVYLPRIEESQATTEGEAEKPLQKGTERILFVDDEAALAEIGRMGLEHLGYEVMAKADSIAALELFRDQPEQFDLVITDYTMPRMTGLELAKEMMRIRPDIPVVLCTGYNEKISEESARKMGINAFAMKPISIRGIAEIIRKVLKARES